MGSTCCWNKKKDQFNQKSEAEKSRTEAEQEISNHSKSSDEKHYKLGKDSIDNQIFKELEKVVKYQKEKIKSLEAELEKRNKEIFEDEDTLASTTMHIGYLEGNKAELEHQHELKERNYQQEIAELKLERDQLKKEYLTMKNDYNVIHEHYTSLYNQYLSMTTQSQVKLD